MASNEAAFNYVFWSNIVGACALVFYLYFLWLVHRGLIKVSPRFSRIVRYTCLFLLMLPIAARYHYSREAILYLSCAIFAVAFLVRMRNKMGL